MDRPTYCSDEMLEYLDKLHTLDPKTFTLFAATSCVNGFFKFDDFEEARLVVDFWSTDRDIALNPSRRKN